MPLYADRNPRALEPYYSRHVAAMTEEGLHEKSAIAAELAARDAEIARLQALPGDAPPPKPLVHSAKASGREVHVVTYLEGGTLPIKGRLLFWCSEDAAECARVLTEAHGKRPRDPRWGK